MVACSKIISLGSSYCRKDSESQEKGERREIREDLMLDLDENQ